MSDVALPADSAPNETSLTDRVAEWGDKVSDRLNPILVKETRQALKSRQFSITFMLLLVVAWLISAAGAMWAGPAIEFGSAGRAFFVYYYFVLAFAIFLIVPFSAFRSKSKSSKPTRRIRSSRTSTKPCSTTQWS